MTSHCDLMTQGVCPGGWAGCCPYRSWSWFWSRSWSWSWYRSVTGGVDVYNGLVLITPHAERAQGSQVKVTATPRTFSGLTDDSATMKSPRVSVSQNSS